MSVVRSQEIGTTIVKKLFDSGFTAFFAGGWVRDLLRGEPAQEIDIATSAPPQKIMELFPKTIPVGIAFGVIIVVEEGIAFEVSTFRKDHAYLDGRHPEGVDYTTPEKDAHRRDFTINGMFFDPLTSTIHDYVGGQEDLKKGIIRAIGNPHERFAEDRLRMIRAIRFAARFGFTIDPFTASAIEAHAASLFPAVSMERIWQELTKMSHSWRFDEAITMLHEFGLLKVLFPEMADVPKEALQKKIDFFSYYPSECPTIIYLLEIFPKNSFEEREQLCRRLKASTTDIKWAAFFTSAEKLFHKETPSSLEWVHFYAHPFSSLYLRVQAAKFLPPYRSQFTRDHEHRIKKLAPHIERIQKHTPLVSSTTLIQAGIVPGPKMGVLLREAEAIAVNEDLSSEEMVMKRLKQHPFWVY